MRALLCPSEGWLISLSLVWSWPCAALEPIPELQEIPNTELASRAHTSSNSIADPGLYRIRLEAVTVLPYLVAGGLALETPGDIRIGLSAGATPTAFIDLARTAIKADQLVASNLVDIFLSHVHAPAGARLDFAWQPRSLGGFYLGLGYGFMHIAATLPSTQVPREVWEDISGMTTASVTEMSATLHMTHAAIGWEFAFDRHWSLKVAIGGSFTFAVNAAVDAYEIDDDPGDIADGERTAEQHITTNVLRYAHTPTVNLGLSYRAF